MPQLSLETYISQYLWLVILLLFFYFFITTQIVPKISEIKKTRARISSEAPSSSQYLSSLSNLQFLSFIPVKKTTDINSKVTLIFEDMNKEWVKK